MKYIIQCVDKDTGFVAQTSKPISKAKAKVWVKQANKDYPHFHHCYVPVTQLEEKDESTSMSNKLGIGIMIILAVFAVVGIVWLES